MLKLTDLPIEILCLIPQFIRNIEDFNNAASACRTLRVAFGTVKPDLMLRLAGSSAPTFFRPHPYYLIMATASQISEWAIGDEERTQELEEAFRGGIDGLYSLCLRVAGLTMADIRRLHSARFNIINPFADKLDQMAGHQWYDVVGFWNGAVSEAGTVFVEGQRAALQVIIYWELFGSSLHAFLQPELNMPWFNLHTRLEYIKYCIPDWVCEGGYPGLEVLPVGPYAPGHGNLEADQIGLQHVHHCSRWRRLWDKPRHEVGADFEDSWRQNLWLNAMYSSGLVSLEVIKNSKVISSKDARYPPIDQPDRVLSEDWRQNLLNLRRQIETLDSTQRPRQHFLSYSHLSLSDAPDMGKEVYACMAKLWY